MRYQTLVRRVAKIAVLLSAAVFVVVGFGLLELGSGRLNPYLRDYAQRWLARDLKMTVKIGGLRGNLLKGFRAERVRLGPERAPLLMVDAVEARYRLTALLTGSVIVDTLVLAAPALRLPEGSAAADAAVSLLPAAESAWWKAGPKREIRVGHVEVVGGRVTTAAAGRADSLDMAAGLRAGPDGCELALRRFRSIVFDPPLVIRNLSGLALYADGRLTFEGIRMQTAGSLVRVDGSLTGLSRPEYDFAFRADSLAFDEIGRILPGAYPRGSLSASGRVWGNASRVHLDLGLRYGSGVCAISGFVDYSGKRVSYDIEASASDVDLARVLPRWAPDARFDGGVRLMGKGLDPSTADVTVLGGIARAQLYGTVVDTADLAASLNNDKLLISIEAEGEAGELDARLDVNRISRDPGYDLRTRFVRLEPARLSRHFPDGADLTGAFWLKRAADRVWRGDARIDVLNIEGLPAATGLAFRGSFREGVVRLDSMSVRLPVGLGVITGEGRVDLGRFGKPEGNPPTYRAKLRLDGLAVDRLLGRTDLLEGASLQFRLNGEGFHPDSIAASADVAVEASRFLGGSLDSARVRVAQRGRRTILERFFLAGTTVTVEGSGWAVPGDSVEIRATGQVYDFEALSRLSGWGISGSPASLAARIVGAWDKPVVRANLAAGVLNYRDDVRAHGAALGTRLHGLTGRDARVRADSVLWRGRVFRNASLDLVLDEAGASFTLGGSTDDVDVLHLRGRAGSSGGAYWLGLDSLVVRTDDASVLSGGPSRIRYLPGDGVSVDRFTLVGDAGRIRASGHTGESAGVTVRLDDVDLKTWSLLTGLGRGMLGTLGGHVTLAGTPDDPKIKSVLDVRMGEIVGVRFQAFSGSLVYGDRRAEMEFSLVQSPGRSVSLKGRFPLYVTPEEREFRLPDGDVRVSVKSDGVDLSMLPDALEEVRGAAGVLAVDVTVEGTPRRLIQRGWLRLRDGAARIAPLNTTIEDVEADLSFDGNRVVVERFESGREKTGFALSGEITLDRLALESYDVTLKANGFEAIDLPGLKAALRADLQLKGDANAGRMEGSVALTRAVLRLSDFMEYPTDVGWITSPFVRNLNCDVRVSAARNVWIRDRELNVEISGDVDLLKDKEGIRLFGALDSRQGRYEFQNTSFAIDRGEINFRGSPDINPELYVIATRRIRLVSGENAVISVVVGGTIVEPSISLESDVTPPLDEADILSYLLIGRPAEDVSVLMRGEGEDGRRLEGRAAGLVLGVAANRLKRTIGRRLNLDVVEIDLGTGDAATRVRAGKYFGSRFFVSYAQDVSEARGREVVVEYELLPQVTLEAQQREGNERERDRKSLGIFWKKEW